MEGTVAEPHLFVIFGGTGDLARRKLLPAMYRIMVETGIVERSVLLGLASSPVGDDAYRRFARESLVAAGYEEAAAWCDGRVHFHQVERGEPTLSNLAERVP